MERRLNLGRQESAESLFLRELAMAARGEKADTMHYTHAAILAAAKEPAAARLFDELAREELSHYEELGQLLLYLDRTLPQGAQGAWHNVFFAKNPHTSAKKPQNTADFIKHAIEEERKGAENYRKLADMTRDDTAHKLLLRLSDEESGHATALVGLQERLKRS